MSVTTEDELELRSSDELAHHVEDVVSNDAFGSGKVADAHLDDPALNVRDVTTLPLLDVGLHLDVLRLPVVVLHRLVEIVSPLVFQGQNVEEHGVAAIDDRFGRNGCIGFFLIEDEGAISNSVGGGIFGHFCSGRVKD